MLSKKERKKCQTIIHTASLAAGTIGAAKIPGSDIVIISAIQGMMILSLGNVLGVAVTKNSTKEMAKTFMIGKTGKGIAGFFLQALPGLGNVVNATVAVTLTEMLGWDTVQEFDERRKEKQFVKNIIVKDGRYE